METIDKKTIQYLQAEDAQIESWNQEAEDPGIASQNRGSPVTRRKRTEEIQFFLKSNTLAVLERLHNIATDNLYTRDNNGNRIRQSVNPGIQLQAANSFLDRSMGKAQVNIDLTSGDRPIVFDSSFNAPPLIAGHNSTETIEDIESIDSIDE